MHSSSRLYVHIVWTTFDRAPCLLPEHDEWLRDCLHSIAKRQRFAIGRVGIASDHAHVLVRLPRDRTVADIVQQLKGVSAHDWNVQIGAPRLQWQPRYWAQSVSPRDLNAVLHYIERQREHHASTVTESWEAPQSASTRASPEGA